MSTTRRVYLHCDRCEACFNDERLIVDRSGEETVHAVREEARRHGHWARVKDPLVPGKRQDVCRACMGRGGDRVSPALNRSKTCR